MSKKEFLCVKTFAADEENYGVDFVAGKVYQGDLETGYVDSIENGTSVWFDGDLLEYFVEVDKNLGDVNAQYRERVLDSALNLIAGELNEFGVARYILPDGLYAICAYVESYRGDTYYLVEPNRVVDNVYGVEDEPSYEPMGEVRFSDYDDFDDLKRCFTWCLERFEEDKAKSLENTLKNAEEKSGMTGAGGCSKEVICRGLE